MLVTREYLMPAIGSSVNFVRERTAVLVTPGRIGYIWLSQRLAIP